MMSIDLAVGKDVDVVDLHDAKSCVEIGEVPEKGPA
jgi:hypothetical protein